MEQEIQKSSQNPQYGRICRLKRVTLFDFIFTLVLCGISFLSDFASQLVGIFLLAFFTRFIFNYFLFSREVKYE